MDAGLDAMGLTRESMLRVADLQLGRWPVRLSGPDALVQSLRQVLQPLSLPDDGLPSLTVTITPDERFATGTVQGGVQWSVEVPRQGWLSVLAGQVVATATGVLQRLLFIHAGAVALGGRGWVLVGESGAGKTSTAAAIVRSGGAYLSDEVALLDAMTRTLHPFTLPMSVKPWTKKAAGQLPRGNEILREGGVQFLLPADVAVTAVPVEAFVLLRPGPVRPRVTPISRAEMLLNIANHVSSFRYRHRCEDAFAGFGRLLQTAQCYIAESSSPAATADELRSIRKL